jgi:hypothetical protein
MLVLALGGYLHLIGKILFRFSVTIINILFKNMVSKLQYASMETYEV